MPYSPADEYHRKKESLGRIRIADYRVPYNNKGLVGYKMLLRADMTREERIQYYMRRADKKLPLFSEINKEGFSYVG